MLRGLRTAIQYFTLGLGLGLLLAPRKGDETRTMLIAQARSYLQDAFAGAQGAVAEAAHHPSNGSRDAYGGDDPSNHSTLSSGQ